MQPCVAWCLHAFSPHPLNTAMRVCSLSAREGVWLGARRRAGWDVLGRVFVRGCSCCAATWHDAGRCGARVVAPPNVLSVQVECFQLALEKLDEQSEMEQVGILAHLRHMISPGIILCLIF
jgi:hypothetical protein